ncbi:MAG: hypothetical protein CSA62_00430 [Planctomycetota bacterium]|nr:MAG: hypothetical protein CSA62_00430 [Planctomycetota bacterium]
MDCPNCGAFVPKGRLACPECGSDENTGWKSSEEIEYQSVDIPDSYEDFVQATRSRRRQSILAGLAFLTLIAFILAWVL